MLENVCSRINRCSKGVFVLKNVCSKNKSKNDLPERMRCSTWKFDCVLRKIFPILKMRCS